MANNFYICEVVDYSTEHILQTIKNNKIEVLEFNKVDEYIYHIKINVKNYNKLLKVFPNLKIIYTHGLFFILKNRLIQKVTLISLVISVVFFIFLSSLIYKIEVKGNNKRITDNIYLLLDEYDIKKYRKIPTEIVLEEVKDAILEQNIEIENIDFQVKGTTILLTYYLKEKENKHYVEYGKYYASKDGIISYYDIEAGNFLFSTNDYVKKGELLIDDYLHIDDKSIYIGGYGKVYAYTWVIVEFAIKSYKMEKVEVYSSMCQEARYKVSKNFTNEEKIIKENVLDFEYGKEISNIKIHYTLLENIAILQKN